MPAPLPTIPVAPIVVSPAVAGEMLGLTRTTIYNLMARGELRSVSIGRARRITLAEIRRVAGLDATGGAG